MRPLDLTHMLSVTQEATLVSIGNSTGVRIKKDLIDELGLKPGDTVVVTVRTHKPVPNSEGFIAAMKFAHENGGIASIPDPLAWEREVRQQDRPLPGREW